MRLPKTTPRMRHTLAAAAAIALLAILALANMRPLRASAAMTGKAGTATATIGDIESTVLASGTLEASNMVNVGTQASGQVLALKVKLGQQVKKGKLIAKIDATAQRSELRTAKAALKNLHAQKEAKKTALRLAELALARQRQMLDQDASSRAEYESAQAAFETARADLVALEAQIDQAKVVADKADADLSYTRIRAPMDGTVVAIVTREGQTVNSAQQVPTIVKIARLDKMTVKAQVSEADVSRIKEGQTVYFSILGEPGRRYKSRLRVIEPVPDSTAQDTPGGAGGGSPGGNAVYYNALFDVHNPDGKLRIAMTTQVTIVVGAAKGAVLIPVSALGEQDGNGRYEVQVLDRNGRAQTRQVRIGLRNEASAQVLDGIKAGEEVVLRASAAADNASTPDESE